MSRVARELARLLGRRRGEVQALQDVAALRGVYRFILLFGAMVLLPAVLLSYFALSSIRAEELYFDAEIDRRADGVADQVEQEVGASFGGFEETTRRRLDAHQSVLSNLSDLSPMLRAAFEFDTNGALVAPFALPSSDALPEPSPYFAATMREGDRAEAEGRPLDALTAYRRALRAAVGTPQAGEAEYKAARALRAAGRTEEAIDALNNVLVEYPNVRYEHKWPVADLAVLDLLEIAFARDPDTGTVGLKDFVDTLLDQQRGRWTIGEPGEAFIARRALDELGGHADPDWLARTRKRLDEQTSQMFWAARLAGRLDDLASTYTSPGQRTPQGKFSYLPDLESSTLWCIVWWGDDLYAFSFDYDALMKMTRQSAEHATATEPQVKAMILPPDVPTPTDALTTRQLQPLAGVSVAVSPADPDDLERTKSRKRTARVVIIAIAVGMSVLGVVLSSRLLANELEAARIKADFAANVSHELRSPITQIRLKGEALQLGLVWDDDDRQQHYDAIVRESERLSRLVDNVLDFAAIESGAKKYTMRPEDIGDVLRNTVESARNAVESRGLSIEADIPDDLPVVWADRDAVSQVLTNLLSNAAKYGAEGGWVGVRARPVDGGVAVLVSDRGMGMSAEDRARIFDRFYRSLDPRVRRHRGTGIGMTIVRYIVDAHGGTIVVDSAPGQGTTFTITFPLQARDASGA